MKQHPINLMSPSIRARTQAGMRTGRFIIIATVAMAVLVVVATHSRLTLTTAERELDDLKAQAEAVFAIDAQAASLRERLESSQQYLRLYEQVAYPLPISGVVATIINALPPSVTLDQMDLSAGARAVNRSPRAKGVDVKDEPAPRILTCEISGFAASDEHIAQLVKALERTPPFRNVNLDFSRTRKVHERDAREFRLSLKIDLNARYEVRIAQRTAGEEVVHAE